MTEERKITWHDINEEVPEKSGMYLVYMKGTAFSDPLNIYSIATASFNRAEYGNGGNFYDFDLFKKGFSVSTVLYWAEIGVPF